MKINKCNKIMSAIVYMYLTLPIFIFVVGWLKWYWAFLFGISILISTIISINSDNIEYEKIFLKQNISKIVIAIILIALWVTLSGIGGVMFQNSDHGARTAMYKALVDYDWPVISNKGNYGLIYYIGYWLPSAVIGKLFGFEIGYKFQMVWAAIGIFIVYLLICVLRKKVSIWPLIIVILFSGLDIVGSWPQGVIFKFTKHLEYWSAFFQYSSNTTQLFWVFNQAIPAWVATTLIVVGKNRKNILFILGSIMLASTFPFVGLIPFSLYFLFRKLKIQNFKEIFSLQNIVGVCVCGGITFLYLIGNISAGKVNTFENDTDTSIRMIMYVLFCIIEFGFYMMILWRNNKKNKFYYLLLIVLVACPLIRVGDAQDFCMRVSIPALFILMILCIEELPKLYKEKNKTLFVCLVICLSLGACTPMQEINRTIVQTVKAVSKGESPTERIWSIEEEILKGNNFSGPVNESLFYKYLAK